ncbi:MAG: hypothetical protein M3Z01_02775 [Thermoproteota archaeon]|nr:hypothetical protein [Thermoproteota archaeon]
MAEKKEDNSNLIQENFCNSLFMIDEKIRFVGIINKNSEVIDGGFKKGIEPLLDVN